MNRAHRLALLYLIVLVCAPKGVWAQATPECSGDASIKETFSNGARWEMCWASRIRENLVLNDVFYTPPNGERKRIFSSARLSQLHVAYDDSDVTYNDITQYGLGGGYLVNLAQADCPYGELLYVQTRPAICRWRSKGQDNYRSASRSVSAESLTLFSVSQVGAYAYIVTWKFFSDGAIEPQIGATGALQRNSDKTELPFGRILQGDNQTLWLSHTHNYYWRLDFDLGQSATDDVVTESKTLLMDSGQRQTQVERFTTEQARIIDSDSPVSWEIWDNLSGDKPNENDSGYRIEPIRYGHRLERKEKEPYTEFDFFVTVANECERFASQNARFNPDCLNHVAQFVNDESLVNADITLWHRVSFHHVPRSEDQRHMHTHWDGFTIEPVNIHKSTPGIDVANNQAPVLSAIGNQSGVVGSVIDWQLVASDADGDSIQFTALNLPNGLTMSESGRVLGTLNQVGRFDVQIALSDEIASTEQTFSWSVQESKLVSTGKSGSIGAVGPLMLTAFLPLLALRLRRRLTITI